MMSRPCPNHHLLPSKQESLLDDFELDFDFLTSPTPQDTASACVAEIAANLDALFPMPSLKTFDYQEDTTTVSEESSAATSSARSSPSFLFSDPPSALTCFLKRPSSVLFDKMTLTRLVQPPVDESSLDTVLSTLPPVLPVRERPKMIPVTSLHRACSRPSPSVAEIDRLLRQDPSSAAYPARISTVKKVWNPMARCRQDKMAPEAYRYPINLALDRRASPLVVSMLIRAAPSALGRQDGPAQETSLSILLKRYSNEPSLVEEMISANAKCLTPDRHANAPLHKAALYQSSLTVVQLLLQVSPVHLRLRNRHGQLPVELAQQRSSTASTAVASLLLEQTQGRI